MFESYHQQDMLRYVIEALSEEPQTGRLKTTARRSS